MLRVSGKIVPFLQTVFVVVCSTARFATVETSSNTRLYSSMKIEREECLGYCFIAIQKENALSLNFAIHGLLPSIDIVSVSRKTIDQELVLSTGLHRLSVKR